MSYQLSQLPPPLYSLWKNATKNVDLVTWWGGRGDQQKVTVLFTFENVENVGRSLSKSRKGLPCWMKKATWPISNQACSKLLRGKLSLRRPNSSWRKKNKWCSSTKHYKKRKYSRAEGLAAKETQHNFQSQEKVWCSLWFGRTNQDHRSDKTLGQFKLAFQQKWMVRNGHWNGLRCLFVWLFDCI